MRNGFIRLRIRTSCGIMNTEIQLGDKELSCFVNYSSGSIILKRVITDFKDCIEKLVFNP